MAAGNFEIMKAMADRNLEIMMGTDFLRSQTAKAGVQVTMGIAENGRVSTGLLNGEFLTLLFLINNKQYQEVRRELDAAKVPEDNYRKVIAEGPYRPSVDRHGCETCGAGKMFDVVHEENGEEIAESTSFEREEDAEDLADALNRGYHLGRNSLLGVLKGIDDMWSDGYAGPEDPRSQGWFSERLIQIWRQIREAIGEEASRT